MSQNSSGENDALLSQFQEICAVDDVSTAALFLQRFQWNLEDAIQHYLAEKDGEGSSDNSHGRADSEQLPDFKVESSDTINASYGLDRMVLVINNASDRSFFNYNRAITDPTADVEKFIQNYEAKYGANHPTFYRGSYSQALSDARKELKYLCIYLHCDTHRDTDKFCNLTLKNGEVIELLNTRTLFWACSIKEREGHRVSQAMHETSYPFVSMICIREGRMMIVSRQEGYLDARSLLLYLNTTMIDNDNYLNLARQERLNQRQNQVLREQQEQAFQESLQRDREKQRLKDEKARQDRERAEREKHEHELLNRMRENLRFKKESTRVSLEQDDEEVAAVGSVVDKAVEKIRVSVKFPSGARSERKFIETDSLNKLFDFVMCHEDCPENFSLFNVLPRQLLLSANLLIENSDEIKPVLKFASFNEAGLHRSATLIVQDNNA
uniref:UBX domain-containing protein n=1 Tax=Romanomermis culicivorax TaxID=13658 RepID=A0A915KMQ0_ROMCU